MQCPARRKHSSSTSCFQVPYGVLWPALRAFSFFKINSHCFTKNRIQKSRTPAMTGPEVPPVGAAADWAPRPQERPAHRQLPHQVRGRPGRHHPHRAAASGACSCREAAEAAQRHSGALGPGGSRQAGDDLRLQRPGGHADCRAHRREALHPPGMPLGDASRTVNQDYTHEQMHGRLVAGHRTLACSALGRHVAAVQGLKGDCSAYRRCCCARLAGTCRTMPTLCSAAHEARRHQGSVPVPLYCSDTKCLGPPGLWKPADMRCGQRAEGYSAGNERVDSHQGSPDHSCSPPTHHCGTFTQSTACLPHIHQGVHLHHTINRCKVLPQHTHSLEPPALVLRSRKPSCASGCACT
jgi:hypothetical protein